MEIKEKLFCPVCNIVVAQAEPRVYDKGKYYHKDCFAFLQMKRFKMRAMAEKFLKMDKQ